MNNILFESAQNQYRQGVFDLALNEFMRALQDTSKPLLPGEFGKIYHQIGNCLMRLGNQQEAIQAYINATQDAEYGNIGSLNYNIGVSYASLKDFENAAKFFGVAVTDEKYDSRYRAYIGLGTSLMKLGKGADAGVAFREAALDESNPDPTKALLNLGVCFMSLERPLDAVTSYESALHFSMNDELKNKLYANLGQAFVSIGQMRKAIQAFEECLKDGKYKLSDSASVDYQKAITATSSEAADKTVTQGPIDTVTLAAGVTAGPVTALTASPKTAQDAEVDDMKGFIEAGDDLAVYQQCAPHAISGDGGYLEQTQAISSQNPGQPQEWPMDKKTAKRAQKQGKKLEKQQLKAIGKKKTGLKAFITILIILIIFGGGAAATFLFGLGIPPARVVVEDFYNNPQANKGMISDSLNDQQKDVLVNSSKDNHGITINGETPECKTYTVYLTMKNNQNKDMHYKVTLNRENLISWKIGGISTNFANRS
ncbi:MAG: tetratricopeptide repeat protein [Eggerthellaceae bacterium]|nr:tetratricopeptide repeat protein [Eggerthellaceae bacterium]